MSSADKHPNSKCRQSFNACFLIANTAMILLMLTNQHTLEQQFLLRKEILR